MRSLLRAQGGVVRRRSLVCQCVIDEERQLGETAAKENLKGSSERDHIQNFNSRVNRRGGVSRDNAQCGLGIEGQVAIEQFFLESPK